MVDQPDFIYKVALMGNPNVGKSTVFNALTGMHQHTGNWPGKTVGSAEGQYLYEGQRYALIDLPGTYSLIAHSPEEEVARDYLCFGGANAVIVVCDATVLERNLNLVFQTLEIAKNVIVCVNLLDEARKKQINLDLPALSAELGVPVIGTSARQGEGLPALLQAVASVCAGGQTAPQLAFYEEPMEYAINLLCPPLHELLRGRLPARFVALALLEGDALLLTHIEENLGIALRGNETVAALLDSANAHLLLAGYVLETRKDAIVSALYAHAEQVAARVVQYQKPAYLNRQVRLDKLLTGRWTGVPLMLLLLALIFYITIAGANIPSQWLSTALFALQEPLLLLFESWSAPAWLSGALILGAYRTLAWVVSVMLPPMAIFFPLFTLLEDLGYLPRVAFNLDHTFKKCNACGKQALTMCMGFGCNAVGVMGCRIIDSPRERLIAILTNNFVPCNGRFPAMIAILTIYFTGANGGAGNTAVAALLLTLVIALGIGMTFACSKLLSRTLLKGTPSSFALELPPYRRPQIGKVLIRSVLDRTLFVLGRAAMVAAPMGLVIWVLANCMVNGSSLLAHGTALLSPIGKFLGLDGAILAAFLLGMPANEIVVPIIGMAYTAGGTLMETASLFELQMLLSQNGWSWVTAVCMLLFLLMHWPCSTTLMTIHKETQSLKWTALAFLLPTASGVLFCALFANACRLLGFA